MQKVEIFTDGDCRGNPGIGDWVAVLRMGKHTKELEGSELNTTSDRMELTAVIEGLKALTRPCSVLLTVDSRYVKSGITQWITKWKNDNWETVNRKPIKDKDLWLQLEEALQLHEVSFSWTRAHAGHSENERADELANEAIDALGLEVVT